MSDDAPRLCLVTPVLDAAEPFLPGLGQALAAGDVASLLLRLAAPEAPGAEKIVRAVAAPAQSRGVALVVAAAPQIALRAGADGAHVAGCGPELADAVERLSPRYIVGAGALETRDDAMRAGELGADYVLFGEEGAAGLDDVAERVGWWAELFNTPCVAVARSLDDIGPLVAAGADFVMLGDCVWSDPRGAGAAIEDAERRLEEAGRGAKEA